MKKGLSDIEEMTVERLKEQLGIEPDQIRDLKGLMGDASDNIPGIPKVGEKTALKLLAEYRTVENLIAHADELKGKLKENVIQYQDQALLSKRLATIKTDVKIPFEAEDFQLQLTPQSLLQFYHSYEMNSLAKKLQEDMSSSGVQKKPADLQISEVSQCPSSLLHPYTALTLDQDQQSVYFAQVYGLALADEHQAVYMRLADVLQDQALLQWLRSDQIKLVYDVKATMHLCDRAGLTIQGMKVDAMIAAFLCDSTLTSDQKIQDRFQLQPPFSLEEVYGRPGKMKLPEAAQQHQYCAWKLRLIQRLWQDSEKKLNEMELMRLFDEVEMPLAQVLYQMEKEGIRIDEQTLDDIARQTQTRLNQLSEAIFQYAGTTFNINSPKQLAEVLFDRLGLPHSGKKTLYLRRGAGKAAGISSDHRRSAGIPQISEAVQHLCGRAEKNTSILTVGFIRSTINARPRRAGCLPPSRICRTSACGMRSPGKSARRFCLDRGGCWFPRTILRSN